MPDSYGLLALHGAQGRTICAHDMVLYHIVKSSLAANPCQVRAHVA